MYVIAINETTCDAGPNAPLGPDPSDTLAYNCLFTVNIATGALTQVGHGFSPNCPVFGLASCASKLWSQVPGLMTPNNGNQPATVGLPWASIDPATGDTIYAISTVYVGPAPTSIEPQGAAPGQVVFVLGTVDPSTGVFTETMTSNVPTTMPVLAFAVAPLPVVPDPVAPVFTR